MKLWARVLRNRFYFLAAIVAATPSLAHAKGLERAKTFKTQSAELIYQAAVDAEKEGDLKFAEDYYRQAALFPDFRENSIISLGRVMVAAGEITEAVSLLEDYVKNGNPFSVDAHLQLADIFIDSDQIKKAEPEISIVEKLHPQYEALHERYGIIAFREGNFEKAAKYLSRVIAKQPDHVKAYKLRYQAYLNLRKTPEAAADIHRLMTLQPNVADHYETLAELYVGTADFESAVQTVQAGMAVKIFSKSEREKMQATAVKIYGQLAKGYYELADFEHTTEILKEALSIRTAPPADRAQFLFMAGALMERENKGEQAEKFYARAFEATQGFDAAGLKYADCLIKRGDFDHSSIVLRKLLLQHPDNEDVAKKLVEMYVKAERRDRLGVFLRDYVDSYPGRVWAMVAYVKLLASIGDVKAAEEDLVRATAGNHVSPDLYMLYAKVLDMEKRYDAARNILSEGVARFPADGRLRFDLAVIYQRAGDNKLAELAYNAVSPEDPDVYYQAKVNLALMQESSGYLVQALGTLTVLQHQIGPNDVLNAKIDELQTRLKGPADRSIATEGDKK